MMMEREDGGGGTRTGWWEREGRETEGGRRKGEKGMEGEGRARKGEGEREVREMEGREREELERGGGRE